MVTAANAVDLVQNRGAKALVTDGTAADNVTNFLNYDADAANDLNVPITATQSLSFYVNFPNAIGADQANTDAYRNTQGWKFVWTPPFDYQAAALAQLALSRATSSPPRIAVYANTVATFPM